MSDPSALTRVDQPISIRAEISIADPDSCKFTVSRMINEDGAYFFANPAAAVGSPFVEQLFALNGVSSVLIAANVVTIGKTQDASWAVLKADIGSTIRKQLLSAMPIILQTRVSERSVVRSDAELGVIVQDLLDREVNPAIAKHGGKISLAHVRDGRLFITMSGGCQGCASSQATLRQGFEVLVKRDAPDIREIIDTTDHAAGRQPYYPKSVRQEQIDA